MAFVVLAKAALGDPPPPVLVLVSPDRPAPGDVIRLSGSDFGTDPALVRVNFTGASAMATAATDTEVTVLVPQAARSGPVTVTCTRVLPGGGTVQQESGAKGLLVIYRELTTLCCISQLEPGLDGSLDEVLHAGSIPVAREIRPTGQTSTLYTFPGIQYRALIAAVRDPVSGDLIVAPANLPNSDEILNVSKGTTLVRFPAGPMSLFRVLVGSDGSLVVAGMQGQLGSLVLGLWRYQLCDLQETAIPDLNDGHSIIPGGLNLGEGQMTQIRDYWALAPDGTIYVFLGYVPPTPGRVLRIDRDGLVSDVALPASMESNWHLAVDCQGQLYGLNAYLTDRFGRPPWTLFKLPQGEPIAQLGQPGQSFRELVFDAFGNFYWLDQNSPYRIIRVMPSQLPIGFYENLSCAQPPAAASTEPAGYAPLGYARSACPVAYPIAILPETTRWKPQRDPKGSLPIEIYFDGSARPVEDIESVVFEVSAPGLPAGYTPDFVFDPAVKRPYKITWNGPWTPPALGPRDVPQPLPRGNYSISIVARQTGNPQPLASGPYSKVSLVEVAGIELLTEAGMPLESNPDYGGATPGGGVRVLPEAELPDLRSRVTDLVKIVARIDPPIPAAELEPPQKPLVVHVRAIDVDDPSSPALPIDDESNRTDNRGDNDAGLYPVPPPRPLGDDLGPTLPNPDRTPIGDVLARPLDAVAPQATAFLQVSRFQGDNYRVAASTSSPWLKGLTATQRSPSGEVVDSDGRMPDEKQALSEMLTAWRTLHLEVDRMNSAIVSQEELQVSGTITGLKPRALVDSAADFNNTDHPKDDDWATANLLIGGTSIPVVANARRSLTVGKDVDLTKVAKVGDPYTVVDDTWRDLSVPLDLKLLRDLFRKAYIEIDDTNQGNWRPLQSFDRNTAVEHFAEFWTRDLSSRPSYWVSQLVSAYESNVDDDYDPDVVRENRGATLGETTGRAKGQFPPGPPDPLQPISAVYFETIPDYYMAKQAEWEARGWFVTLADVFRQVTAHEIGHSVGLSHLTGFLMTPGGYFAPDAFILSDDQVGALRKMARPRHMD